MLQRACELITPTRPAGTFEHALAHERLQHRLEMSPRQLVAMRQRLGCNRMAACVECDIDDGSNCQQSFVTQKRHCVFYRRTINDEAPAAHQEEVEGIAGAGVLSLITSDVASVRERKRRRLRAITIIPPRLFG